MQFTSIENFCTGLGIPKHDSIRAIIAEHEFLTGLFRKTAVLTARVNELKSILIDRFQTIPEFKEEYKSRIMDYYSKTINQASQNFIMLPVPIVEHIPVIRRPIAIRIPPPAFAVSPNHTDSNLIEDDDPDKEILEIDIPALSEDLDLGEMFDLMIKMMKLRGESHMKQGFIGRKMRNDLLIQRVMASHSEVMGSTNEHDKWKAIVKYRNKCVEIQRNKAARASAEQTN